MEFVLPTLTTRDLGSVNLECLIYKAYTGSQRAMSEGRSDKGKKSEGRRQRQGGFWVSSLKEKSEEANRRGSISASVRRSKEQQAKEGGTDGATSGESRQEASIAELYVGPPWVLN